MKHSATQKQCTLAAIGIAHTPLHTHSIKRNKKKGEKEENKRAILNEKYATGPVLLVCVCGSSSESSELDATTTTLLLNIS